MITTTNQSDEAPKGHRDICGMLGIHPARKIARRDIEKAYPGMKLVQERIWRNINQEAK